MEKKENYNPNQRPKSPGPVVKSTTNASNRLGATMSTVSNSSASGNNNRASKPFINNNIIRDPKNITNTITSTANTNANANNIRDVNGPPTARERFQSLVLSRAGNAVAVTAAASASGKALANLTPGPSSRINAITNNNNMRSKIVDPPRMFARPISQIIGTKESRPTMQSKSMSGVGAEKSRNLRAFVEKAMAEHKVFSCVGVYPAIKNALKKRGWVEKTGPINAIRSANVSTFRSNDVVPDEESDQSWVTRNLRDYPPDFIWVIRRDNIDWKGMHPNQIINRYPKAWFTTKVGLTACLQNMHWYSEAGFSETFFPRCYRLCLDEEKQAFQEDYRLTACMSYLRHFVETFESKGAASLVDPASKITPLSIDFASRQLGNYIRMRRHEDIDWLLPPNFMSQHWEAFLHQYSLVIKEHRKIRFDTQEAVKIKYDMAKKSLVRVAPFWPQSHLDGIYNMWICKPGARSRGKGIVIMNSLDKIMELLNHSNYREANWVVQKYMERPLLVYKTKFDIRQWFIITDWNPLTLWFYKESYVRFCTKPFVLEDFHESIHLCNNAIQCRYQNAETRDSALPDENMWDCYTFQAYLKTIGKLDFWPKIYEGMKRAIIGVLLASQENVDPRRGCFELYGADFMLSEDFNPWLIEINSCPCMAASTSVTARMCAQCLEDTVKVVVDRRNNRNADTGMFEMVYKQPTGAVQVQQFTGHDLVVHGKKLTRDIDWPSMMTIRSSQVKRASLVTSSPIVRAPTPQLMLPLNPPPENLTFSDLLTKLRMKNTELFQGYVSKSEKQTLVAASSPDPDDNSFAALLSKMRTLSKGQNNVQDITFKSLKNDKGKGSKSNRPRTPISSAENSIAYLSKYFDNNASTFENLARIEKQIKTGQNKDSDNNDKSGNRPTTPNSNKLKQNPYLPTGEAARTLEEVRAAVNAATEKYAAHLKTKLPLVPTSKELTSMKQNPNLIKARFQAK